MHNPKSVPESDTQNSLGFRYTNVSPNTYKAIKPRENQQKKKLTE